MKKFKIIALVVFVFTVSCKKILEVDLPIGTNTVETVFKEKETAVAAVTGVYAGLNSATYITGLNGLAIRLGLQIDELKPVTPAAFLDYQNISQEEIGMWRAYSELIYQLNRIIQGVASSQTLSQKTKDILTGESKFTRAWLYFYLVNLYGDVPLVLTTDFRVNANIPRSPESAIYQQMIEDLKEAQIKLSNSYLQRDITSLSPDRIRPNRAAATALLSRIYLYTGDWSNAEMEASKVITNSDFHLQENLNTVFLRNSKETIWALQPNLLDPDGVNTKDGRWLLNPVGGEPFFDLSSFLINSFEDSDKRKIDWVSNNAGHIVPFKYKEGWATYGEQKEFYVVLRLAEQYLIRAEARAQLNKLSGDESALTDLNKIRLRAGLDEINPSTQQEILSAIHKERRLELFLEFGHRWFDMKRTQQLDGLMRNISPFKQSSWAFYKVLFPIPYSEFQLNPALRGHQNPGYTEQP